MNDNKNFIYEKVTVQILDDLMRGQIPWRNVRIQRKGEKWPYTNPYSKTVYSPFNAMLLGRPGEWATIKQINDHGGRVKKGSKGKVVIKWIPFEPKKHREEIERLKAEGKSYDHLLAFDLRYYTVFNLDDTEGLKPREAEAEQPQMQAAENPTAFADVVIRDYRTSENVRIVAAPDDTAAAWHPATDTVEVPGKETYALEEDWYATLFGQLVHSTSTEKRCNRAKEYEDICAGAPSLREELTAEIGSSMLLSTCGLERAETKQQISAQCKRWIDAMNSDVRLIVQAAPKAEKAAKYILGDFAA